MSGSDGGPGRREVAVRCFAAVYDDAELEYSESDEERAPNYVVTPTGARVNRLFLVGVLTEVEAVSEDVLRGRVVDPTGAFVVYAGQYQPDAKTFLERADPPAFVAVTGKARTFRPDDGDRVFTSVRPESINAVDAETRDRWTVQAAEQTVERVATCAAALEREERGDALRAALEASGVDPALAAGIPRAIDHYGTTEAYLAAVRELAIQAAAVVAGERDEVEPLDVAPDSGGAVEDDLTGDVVVEPPAVERGGEPASAEPAGGESAATGEEAAGAADAEAAVAETTATAEAGGPARHDVDASEEDSAAEPADQQDGGPDGEDDLGDFEAYDADEPGAASAEAEADASGDADGTTAESATGADAEGMYEVDEAERESIEAEYGTDFSTGNEVDEPGEADIETPGPVEDEAEAGGPDEAAEGVAEEAAAEGVADEAETDDAEPVEASEVDEGSDDDAAVESAVAAEEGAGDVDLEDAAVEAMAELDDGDGAEREAVVAAVVDAHGADPDAVEDAIQEALMGGRCYEPTDDRLKAI